MHYSATDMVAETLISEKRDSDGVVVIPCGVNRIKDVVTEETIPGVLIKSYQQASVTYNPAGIEVISVRPGDLPFNAPVVNIDNPGGYTTLSQSAVSGSEPPFTIANLVPRLVGCALNSYELTLDFSTIVNTNGGEMRDEKKQILTVMRGDVNGDGVVNIIDAMFGAQYLVGLRPIEQIRPLNLASIKHDGENGDVMNIIDCMFIAQYCVGLRDCYFN